MNETPADVLMSTVGLRGVAAGLEDLRLLNCPVDGVYATWSSVVNCRLCKET